MLFRSLNVLNTAGAVVPFSSFASVRWAVGPMQTIRYNGYPSIRLEFTPLPGISTGDVMAKVEQLVAELPQGYGYEWTGISFEEKRSGSQVYILYAFSLLAIFLCLAALYESWAIPLSVLLVVPLGVLGVVLAAQWGGLENDVYFKLGMITIIGLSAKNAILIIEFAKELHEQQGKSVAAAALQAAHLRFRPILMTSLAFTLGVVPLTVAIATTQITASVIVTAILTPLLTAWVAKRNQEKGIDSKAI